MLIAARSSKLRAFCRLAIAMAVRKASSTGAVFAPSRLSKISPRMRWRKSRSSVLPSHPQAPTLHRSGPRLHPLLAPGLRSRRAGYGRTAPKTCFPESVYAAKTCRNFVAAVARSSSSAEAKPASSSPKVKKSASPCSRLRSTTVSAVRRAAPASPRRISNTALMRYVLI